MDYLDDSDTGTYCIFSQTSRYIVDLDRGRMIRHPGVVAGTHVDGDLLVVLRDLPNDNEWVPLILLAECEVGAPLLAFTGDDEHGYRWRISTQIRSIVPLPDQDLPSASQEQHSTGVGPAAEQDRRASRRPAHDQPPAPPHNATEGEDDARRDR